jgi:hypothetical protein
MEYGYWLNPDGSSYWGVRLAWRGKIGVARKITAYTHQMSQAAKQRIYNWINFW